MDQLDHGLPSPLVDRILFLWLALEARDRPTVLAMIRDSQDLDRPRVTRASDLRRPGYGRGRRRPPNT